MRYLTIEQRESLEQSLRERATQLRGEISGALRQQDTAETLHLANRLDETGDDALADLEISLDIASVERDMGELRNVIQALGRIHTPEFGVCSDCEAEIPFRRLEVEPTALRCVTCQDRYEHSHTGAEHSSL